MNNVCTRLLTALLLVIAPIAAQATDFRQFYGTYKGETVEVREQQEIKRDLSVEIRETDDGFRVDWKTTSVRSDGREKSKSYSIDFFPSGRANIFSSAMKANLFGGRQPLDPMRGDPYVWAQIENDVMTVHALIITEEGGYEMLTYERRLTDEGMEVKFNRVRDGVPQKEITAVLTRTDG